MTNTILTAVRDYLESKADIRHAVRGKIYYGRAPQRVTKPYILLNRVASNPDYHLLNQADATHVTVQVDCYSHVPSESEHIAELARLAMSGAQNQMWGNRYVFGAMILREDTTVDKPQDGSDKWTYNLSRDYDISHREPVPTH